jgi:TetR/AcrR family transcriptional repressor of bet genes
MAKAGVETMRRRALIGAAIEAIHARGSLDVTVSEIAGRAGVSSALAHHYFGAKDALLLAAMRHLLTALARDVAARLRGLDDPRARVSAVIAASFSPEQFRRETVSAWLAFYVMAQGVEGARRLLRAYFARLRSNFAHPLGRLMPRAEALAAAEGAGALIDGLYLRQALGDGAPDAAAAIAAVEAHVDARLAARRA